MSPLSPPNSSSGGAGGGNHPAVTSTSAVQSYLPPWVSRLRPTWGHRLVISEWHDPHHHPEDHDHAEHRSAHGWHGNDLVHDANSPVRISEYWASYASSSSTSTTCTTTSSDGEVVEDVGWDGVGTVLTGVVHFTPSAESHRGYSHGGAACSIMDDAVGWTGFLVSGELREWSGYTAQINTRLCRPIKVGSVLMVRAEIVRRAGRKVYVEVRLVDPNGGAGGEGAGDGGEGEEVVHATCDGLFVLSRLDEEQREQGENEQEA